MWPYNEDEAGWLKPSPAARPLPASANDNDSALRLPARTTPPSPPPTRKTAPET